MKNYLFAGIRGYGKVHVIDLDTFTISHSKEFTPETSGGQVLQIKTTDSRDIYIGIRESDHSTYFRVDFNLNEQASFTTYGQTFRQRPIISLHPTDDNLVYLGDGGFYVSARDKNFQFLEVVGGENPHPYYEPVNNSGLFFTNSIIAHDPIHDKLFLYYGGRRSVNYYYFTSVYCVPLDDLASAPNGDFKAIGQTNTEIIRDEIYNWCHYVDAEGIPYMFVTGVGWNANFDGPAQRLAKVRLTDPWTITKTPDTFADNVSFIDAVTGSGTEKLQFLYGGYLYNVGARGEERRKAISIINPDTLALEDKYDYSGDVPPMATSSIVDEENGVFYVGCDAGILLKLNLSTMEIVGTLDLNDTRSVVELQFVDLLVHTPILNLQQIDNKVSVGWTYDT